MSHNINGLIYEQKVYTALKEAEQHTDLVRVIGDAPSGGFSAHDTDMKLSIFDQLIDLEIKADMKAQMGGTSFTYDRHSKLFQNVKDLPQEDLDIILSETETLKDHLDNLIDFISLSEPVSYNSKNVGFPLNTTKEAWSAAQDIGLIKPLNAKIRRTADFIRDHYAKKNVFYIQIGNAGLFYLKDNPLDLPIPQLNGEINLEVRPGRNGSTRRLYEGKEYAFASAGIRIQGRLQFSGKSEYSLDDPVSIVKMLSHIK